MKILRPPEPISVQIELNYMELCGLLKMIGSTSTGSRMQDFALTSEESDSLSDVFMILADFVPEEDR